MRVLFVVFGSRPHIYPLVPLAWAFRAAGHEVRLCGTPAWAADLTYTGLAAVTAGGSPQVPDALRAKLATAMFTQESWPPDWAAHPERLSRARLDYLESVGRYLIAAAAAMVDDVVAFARDWAPDAIVYDSFSYAGPATAAALGVPGIRHLGGTDSAQRLEMVQPGREPLPEYAALFERFGVAARTDALSTVDPTPPSMRLVIPDGLRSMRYIAHNGPGAVPDGLFGRRPRPRICVTWGHTISAVGTDGTDPFVAAIGTITALGMDCIVAAPKGDLARLGPLPDSVRAIASVPLSLVLPHCDAIVHQGGDGTALTAATTAIPQLVIAASPEADMCGGRLSAAGAGIYLRHPDLREDPDGSPVVIRHALQALLSDPRFADGAGRLRDEIESQPPPAVVARRLVAMVSESVPVGG